MLLFLSLIFLSFNLSSKPVKGFSWSRHDKVKYLDINLALGIQKEFYYDFDVSHLESTDKTKFEVKMIKPEGEDKELKSGTKLVFTPMAEGKTDLWIYDQDGVLRFVHAVNVTSINYKRIYSYIKHEFRNIEGLKIKWYEDKIILDGEILLPSDMARIHQVITLFDKSVFKIMYKMSPMLFKIVAAKMEKELANPNIHVKVINNKFVVTGFVYSTDELKEIQDKLVLYLPRYYYKPKVGAPSGGDFTEPSFAKDIITWDLIKIIEKDEPSYLIKITVYFVEVNKVFSNNFGFSWAPSLDTSKSNSQFTWSTDSNTNTVATVTGIVSNFIPKLSSIVSSGHGRVIQSIASTVNEGKTASVGKQTNMPYVIPAPPGGQSSIGNAQTGITLGVTPTIIGADKAVSKNVRLETNISVSQVVSMTDGIPTTTSNNINTTIDIESEQAAAIGGVIQSASRRDYGNKPPNDNVIINLSRSKNFQEDKTQFIIFILPKIIKNAKDASRKILKKFRME